MRNFIKKYLRASVISFVVIISLMLIAAAVTMLIEYSNEIAKQSSSRAAYYTLVSKQSVEDRMDKVKEKAISVAYKASDYNTENGKTEGDLQIYLSSVQDVDFIRYYTKEGVLYGMDGILCSDEKDVSREWYKNNKKKAGYVGAFDVKLSANESDTSTMTYIGFYAPVENSDFADAVVLYYTENKTKEFYSMSDMNELADFSVLCTNKGTILVGYESVDNMHVLSVLRNKVGEKSPIDEAENFMKNGQSGVIPVKISGENYLISVGADKTKLQNLCVVELYKADALYAASFVFIDTIIGIFIIFAVIAIFVVGYLSIHRAILKREFLNMETMNNKLNCFNRHGFEKEAEKIVERNHNSYFAMIVFQLRHFKFLLETYGESETDSLLQYLKLISAKTVQIEEVYGHIENGQFLLLLHAKDKQALLERLKIHASLAAHYKGAQKFDVLLRYGIYELDRTEKISVTQMIDFALEANNSITQATAQNATMQFNFYNNELRKIRLINEDMELRMEGALQNGEFQVFYQPKYNLRHDRQDGAEALVRWYDAKANVYNRPALFMPLFESNGFIVKLDKYVYTKVCEYISYSISQGQTVFPVSVNVSRITAVQPDFIDFYARTKRKYGISDGQIMIEFTESFAYENYETLAFIADSLHKNGFKCSIDDFGSGYSSYRILKSLQMDEIKLDKFFIEKGMNEERDFRIIESIIGVAKKLGMKVTQEGVETAEDVEKLRKLGCDVIQGYYYAHPLFLSNYYTFVSNTFEHNLKKLDS